MSDEDWKVDNPTEAIDKALALLDRIANALETSDRDWGFICRVCRLEFSYGHDVTAHTKGCAVKECPQCQCPARNHTFEADSRSAFCPDGSITPGGYWRHVARFGVRS